VTKRFFSILFAAALFAASFNLSLAATRTWDGEGTTNNWSEAANWSDNTVPVTADAVVFDGTSTKSSTVDAAFTGTVTTLSINSGFNGILTLGRSLTMSGTITQAAGTFDAVSYDVTASGQYHLFRGDALYGIWHLDIQCHRQQRYQFYRVCRICPDKHFEACGRI